MVAHYVRWFNKIDKSRKFTCHADIPGVGGGRNEPYKRYSDLKIHDQVAKNGLKRTQAEILLFVFSEWIGQSIILMVNLRATSSNVCD